MNNDSLDYFNNPDVGQAYINELLRAQAVQQPTQSSAYMGTDSAQQPVPPVGAGGGPLSVGPAAWPKTGGMSYGGHPNFSHIGAFPTDDGSAPTPTNYPNIRPFPNAAGNTLGIPQAPASVVAAKPANNAGQGYHGFKAAVNNPPTPVPRPADLTPAAAPAAAPAASPAHSQHQANIIENLLKIFGVIGNGIGHVGQDIGHGLDSFFHQNQQAPQAAPQAYQASAAPQAQQAPQASQSAPTTQGADQGQNTLEGILSALFKQGADTQPMDHGQTPNGY